MCVHGLRGSGCQRNDAAVVFSDSALSNWDVRGGTLAREIDWGLDLNA